MFSPYYAWARRRRPADPTQHVALNVALYGTGGKRWALTERGGQALRRDATTLAIGPSKLAWDGSTLTIRIDEVTAPLPLRIRGIVRVHTRAPTSQTFTLDEPGRHRWWPIDPTARVEVALERPGLNWSGAGYLDTNEGDEPLEAAFSIWDWSRAALPHGAAILYEARRRDGSEQGIAIRIDRNGTVEPFTPPPRMDLPRGLWRVARGTRSEAPATTRVVQSLEDSPFYTRSVLRTRLLGQELTAVHESLDLDRFRQPWVQLMVPFRMPRALW